MNNLVYQEWAGIVYASQLTHIVAKVLDRNLPYHTYIPWVVEPFQWTPYAGESNSITLTVKVWMTRHIFLAFFPMIPIKVHTEPANVVKTAVKFWHSQMNFQLKFPCDINCRKRHYSESTLLHLRACVIGSQSPNFVIHSLRNFWCCNGLVMEAEVGTADKTNTFLLDFDNSL